MVSDDYLEIAELFGKRINGQVEKTREEFARIVEPGFDDTPLTRDDCDPVSYADSILDKVIVIKAEVLLSLIHIFLFFKTRRATSLQHVIKKSSFFAKVNSGMRLLS